MSEKTYFEPNYEYLEELPADLEFSKGSHKGKYTLIIEEWLKSGAKNLRFKCHTEAEMKTVRSSSASYKRKHNANFTIWKDRKTYDVYLIKA